ncbi:MAG: hypothetical protein K2X47_14400 [Bdellovibrionales bacterium]|nr:hypothetical protein [Bdellovibrionales bacterium]
MDSQLWYMGFVVAHVLGFLTCDMVLLKGQLFKSLGKNPLVWVLPQRDLPAKIEEAFPKTSVAQYARANLMAPSEAMTTPVNPEDAFTKVKELKKTLEKRNQELESIQ